MLSLDHKSVGVTNFVFITIFMLFFSVLICKTCLFFLTILPFRRCFGAGRVFQGFVAMTYTQIYSHLDYVHFGALIFRFKGNKPLFRFRFEVQTWKTEQ